MRHKHNWQFKEENKKIVKYIKPKLWKQLISVYSGLFPIYPIYEYYNVFVCECGKEKEVLIKYE